jgi:hypothetical protein
LFSLRLGIFARDKKRLNEKERFVHEITERHDLGRKKEYLESIIERIEKISDMANAVILLQELEKMKKKGKQEKKS